MIQALNFSSTIAFLACSREIPNIKNFVTPSFKRRLESARKMVTQDSDLFGTITDANQYSQEATRLFRSFLSLAASRVTWICLQTVLLGGGVKVIPREKCI